MGGLWKEGGCGWVNTRVRGFWMGGNLDVLDYRSYMKKFVWGDIEPFHCGFWCSTESESFGQSSAWY